MSFSLIIHSTGVEKCLFVIDEIGKMELFSTEFVKSVQALFNPEQKLTEISTMVVLATIPVARQRSHWLVEELRRREDCLLFEVWYTFMHVYCLPKVKELVLV